MYGATPESMPAPASGMVGSIDAPSVGRRCVRVRCARMMSVASVVSSGAVGVVVVVGFGGGRGCGCGCGRWLRRVVLVGRVGGGCVADSVGNDDDACICRRTLTAGCFVREREEGAVGLWREKRGRRRWR